MQTTSSCRPAVFGSLALLVGISLWGAGAAAQDVDQYFEPSASAIGGGPADPSRGLALTRFSTGGVRAGSFVIRPDIYESFGYNSNVEGFSGGRGSAVVSSVGSVRATSDWSRNSAFLAVTVNDQRYLDLPRQSFTNWSASTGGTVDVGRDRIGAAYTHQNLTQTPGSLDFVTIAQPVAFRVDRGELSYTATSRGRFSFIPELSVTNYDYDNYTIGNRRISQEFRNRVAIQGGVTVRYEFAPQRQALLLVRGSRLSYSTSAAGAPKRDSNGVTVLGGLDYPAVGSNFRFRALAGVQVRNYDNSAYSNLISPIVEASVTWTPTRLTSVTLLARREIEDASDESIAGYTYTSARLGVEHELRRNIILSAYGGIVAAEFQSSNLNLATTQSAEAGTTQNILIGGAGVTWLLNRNIRAGASYGVSSRSGAGASSNYTSSIGLLSIGFRL